jgi:hypothetical protein
VAEGIDGASRAGADFGADVNVDSILGPAVSDTLWQHVHGAVVAAGWDGVTVDAFASESNARVPHQGTCMFVFVCIFEHIQTT